MQCFIRVLAGFYLIGISLAQMLPEVIVYPLQQMLVEGDPYHFVCRVTQPITSCRIALPSGRGTFSLDPNSTDARLGVDYFGHGFEAGECGLNVSSSELSSHGTFTCSMSVQDSIFEAQGKRQIAHGIQQTKQDETMRASNTISETLVMNVSRNDNGTKLRCVAQDMDDVHSDQLMKTTEYPSLMRTLTGVLGGVFLVLVATVVLFMLWRKHAQRTVEVVAEVDELDKRSASPANGVYWAKTRL
ncbi:hypothetical protein B566_EDAN007449 [Ephemera danica]|nr:hypothetical protein B566_EDAN007449 [Ephemera danica]